MPESDKNILKFNDYHLQNPTPFIIIAVFESFIIPIHTTEPALNTSYTLHKQGRVPYGYAYIIIHQDGKNL